MKRSLIFLITVLAAFCLAGPAQAQEYLFGVEQEIVQVFVNADGTVDIAYTWTFVNQPGAHAIDFVDVGVPVKFDLGNIRADVDGADVLVSRTDYMGSGTGFAIVLGAHAIPPGERGTVHVTITGLRGVLGRDSSDAAYASLVFSPTWFGRQYVSGTTDVMVIFHLPPDVPPESPRYHVPQGGWNGNTEAETALDEAGRIAYGWRDPQGNAYTPYTFGASFPAQYVPAWATEMARPTNTPSPTLTPKPVVALPTPRPAYREPARNDEIVSALTGLSIFILLIGIAVALSKIADVELKSDYEDPRIQVESLGIKRGLTAVEAAILLERPVTQTLTMILFSILRKKAARVITTEPLELKIADPLPVGLCSYELAFLRAMRLPPGKARDSQLTSLLLDLCEQVNLKIRGFSREMTRQYYQGIVNLAWAAVREAATPEVKERTFEEKLDWLTLEENFADKMMAFAQSNAVDVMPSWWANSGLAAPASAQAREPSRQAPEPGVPSAGRLDIPQTPYSQPKAPSALVEPPISRPAVTGLPGADRAADLVRQFSTISAHIVKDASAIGESLKLINAEETIQRAWKDADALAERKAARTESVDRSDGSVWDIFSGSGSSWNSSSSSHHDSCNCACACACAGCACACAGGGR